MWAVTSTGQGRKFHLAVPPKNKHNISQEQFLKGTQIIQPITILVRIDMCTQHVYIVKSSHLYLYSAFNNTNCNKALHNIKIGKFCQ